VAGKGRDENVGASPRAVLLKQVFSEHASFVWRSLRRLDVAPADVDDALHEVFLVVFGLIIEYEHQGLMRAWLFKISPQVANNYHRGNKRAEIRSGTDVDEMLDRLEGEEVVRSFFDNLDEMERMVF
jgi:RNA polymerase sigma-70 factor, ECF subfamily